MSETEAMKIENSSKIVIMVFRTVYYFVRLYQKHSAFYSFPLLLK